MLYIRWIRIKCKKLWGSLYDFLKDDVIVRNVVAAVAVAMIISFIALNEPRLTAVSEWEGARTTLEENSSITGVVGMSFKVDIFNWGFESGGIKDANVEIRNRLLKDVNIKTTYVDRDAIKPFETKEITIYVRAEIDMNLDIVKWEIALYDPKGEIIDSKTFSFKKNLDK